MNSVPFTLTISSINNISGCSNISLTHDRRIPISLKESIKSTCTSLEVNVVTLKDEHQYTGSRFCKQECHVDKLRYMFQIYKIIEHIKTIIVEHSYKVLLLNFSYYNNNNYNNEDYVALCNTITGNSTGSYLGRIEVTAATITNSTWFLFTELDAHVERIMLLNDISPKAYKIPGTIDFSLEKC